MMYEMINFDKSLQLKSEQLERLEVAIAKKQKQAAALKKKIRKEIFSKKLYRPLADLIHISDDLEDVRFEYIELVDDHGNFHFETADGSMQLRTVNGKYMIHFSDSGFVGDLDISSGDFSTYTYGFKTKHPKMVGFVDYALCD